MNYLDAIVQAFEDTTDNLLIVAEAGSGKTTMLLELARRLPPSKLSVALAFGTDIAAELSRRMPFWVQTATSHTYGKRILERHVGAFKLRVVPDKCRRIAKEAEANVWAYWSLTGQLVSLMKNYGHHLLAGAPSPEDIVTAFELYCDGDESEAILLAEEVFRVSIAEPIKTIDFDDMLDLPLRLRAKFDPCDYVLVDEAQDLNAVQHEMIRRMLKPKRKDEEPGGRLIAVGDPRQAIFGFRGADHLSMEHLAENFNCRILPLSQTYRCAVSVVDEANAQWAKWNLPETLQTYVS